jgi:putative ABC transport system ATP-binding protein
MDSTIDQLLINPVMNRENGSFIHFSGLRKSFKEGTQTRYVLRDTAASFGQGESIAILGQSGSGKSTLLNLISGIDHADEGSIWVNSQELTAMTEQERTLFRRHHIGVIFQFFNLIPTLTVWENVILPLELSGIKNGDLGNKAAPLLDAVGLLHRRDTFPDRLSGGEQQRVAIARALVNDPLLVLADEPTGNLDEATGQQILELLDSLTRQAGKNMIMVTHSHEAAAYADRTLRLQNGHLIEIGNTVPAERLVASNGNSR